MKHSLILFFSLFLFTHCVEAQSAYDYFAQINEHYNEINKDTWSYIKQVSRGRNARRIDKKRQELIGTLRNARYQVSQSGSFEGDASLRNATKDYLSLLILSLNEDYKRIVDLEEIAEESYDAMEAYILTKERVNSKIENAFDELQGAQNSFASKHNINLVEDESRISKKLNNAGEVISYYNKLYLLFYKPYWYENQLLKAMEENRIGDMEQYRQTLASTAKEALDSLQMINDFYDNSSLKQACNEILYFLHGEGERYVPDLIGFYITQNKMQEASNKMESTPRKKLTQNDIDNYNQIVNNYNEEVNSFNETQEYLNKFRSKALENWEKTASNFYDEYL